VDRTLFSDEDRCVWLLGGEGRKDNVAAEKRERKMGGKGGGTTLSPLGV